MAAVLVALLAFTVQSCGSDDDDVKLEQYKTVVSMKITEAGAFTPEQCEALIMEAHKETLSQLPSDQAAIEVSERAAQLMAEQLKLQKNTFGDAVFYFTMETTNVSTGKQVITYYVYYDKGEVRYNNNKN